MRFLIFLFLFVSSIEMLKAQNELEDKIWQLMKIESLIDYNRSLYEENQHNVKIARTIDFTNNISKNTTYDSLGNIASEVFTDLDWLMSYRMHLTGSSIVIWNEQYKKMDTYEMKFILTDSLSINYDCTHSGWDFYTYKVQEDTLELSFNTLDPPKTQNLYFIEQKNVTVPDFRDYSRFDCILLHATVKSSTSDK